MEHILNEKLKRLEPTGSTCYYCGNASSNKMSDNYFLNLYKEVDRTNVIVYRNVKFNKISIGIPRCASCKKIHNKSHDASVLYSILIVILIMVISFYIWGGFGFFAIFVCIPIGVFGQGIIKNKLISAENILKEKDGAKKSDTVKEFIIRGWSFNQPTA